MWTVCVHSSHQTEFQSKNTHLWPGRTHITQNNPFFHLHAAESSQKDNKTKYLYRQLCHIHEELSLLDSSCPSAPQSYRRALQQVQGIKSFLQDQLRAANFEELEKYWSTPLHHGSHLHFRLWNHSYFHHLQAGSSRRQRRRGADEEGMLSRRSALVVCFCRLVPGSCHRCRDLVFHNALWFEIWEGALHQLVGLHGGVLLPKCAHHSANKGEEEQEFPSFFFFIIRNMFFYAPGHR